MFFLLLVLAAVSAAVVGSVLGIRDIFGRYGGAVSTARDLDTLLAQDLAKERSARTDKDRLLDQTDALLRSAFDAEVQIRLADYDLLEQASVDETTERIAAGQALRAALDAERQDRMQADAEIADGLANVTAETEMAETLDMQTLAKLRAKMENITRMAALLDNATFARVQADMQLMFQGALADATLLYLTNKLSKARHEREIKDSLIDQQIAHLSASEYLQTVNGRGSVNREIRIESTNDYTTLENAPGTIGIRNNGILDVNGVTVDPTDFSLQVEGGRGIEVTTPDTNTVRFASTVIPVQKNIYTDGTVSGPFNIPISDPTGATNRFLEKPPWTRIPCTFTAYEGHTCGWSPTETGTYLVEISVTITPPNLVFALDDGTHLQLGVTTGPYVDAINNPNLTPEMFGSIDAIDSVQYYTDEPRDFSYPIRMSGQVLVNVPVANSPCGSSAQEVCPPGTCHTDSFPNCPGFRVLGIWVTSTYYTFEAQSVETSIKVSRLTSGN